MPAPPSHTFALPPLETRLISREGVGVRPLDPETGRLGRRVERMYSGIDLDLWAHCHAAPIRRCPRS